MKKNQIFEGTEKRILIVDDDTDFADSLADILDARDYKIRIANSDKKAISIVKDFDAHVALIDLRLGHTSGIDLIEKLKQEREDLICVMVTAYASTETAIEALQYGAYDYLRKPIVIHDLLNTLSRCFEKMHLEKERTKAEEALRRNENILKQAQQIARMGTFEWDLVSNKTAYSDEIYQIHGLNPQDFKSKNEVSLIDLVVHPDDRANVNEAMRRIILEHRTEPFEYRIIRPGAEEEGFIYTNGNIIYDASGKAARLVGYALDITERKRAEQALISRLRYEEGLAACSRTLLTDTEDALLKTLHHLLTASGVSRVYIFENCRNSANELCMRQTYEVCALGITPEIDNPELQFYPYKNGFLRWQKELSKGKSIVGLVRSFPDSEQEMLIQQGILSILALPFFVGGEWHGLVGFDDTEREREWGENDIRLLRTAAEMIGSYTDRKMAGESILKSEEKYRLLANNVTDVIWTMDFKSNITYTSPSVEKLIGYTVEEVLSQSANEILISSSLDYIKMIIDEEMENILNETFQPRNVEIELIHKDGSVISAESTISIMYDMNKKPINILGITRDTMERKKSEAERDKMQAQLRQSQKIEAIGTLAGGIAHDFNNILSGILGYTELSLRKILPQYPVYNYLEEILQAGKRASGLVKQILTLSRQQELEKKPISISPIIKEAVALLRASVPTTVEIHTDISTQFDVIYADTTQIHQIIINLCTNAAHAMREKGGILSIDLDNVDIDSRFSSGIPDLNEGQYLRLKVGDTGHGIPPEIIDNIFNPFFTTKEKGEGTGLGLSVIHGIVKSHEGAIVVKSEVDKGTTFIVYLPLDKCIQRQEEKREPQQFHKGSGNVLVVDDEPALVELEQLILEDHGFNVIPRTSSLEAMEAFKAKPDNFDIVITDQTMPNLTGVNMAREMLEIRPDIPIILCTGFSEQVSPEEAKAIGIREYLFKPVVSKDFIEAVQRALGPKKERHKRGQEEIITGDISKVLSFNGMKVLVAEDMDSNRSLIGLMLKNIGCESELVSNGKEALALLRDKEFDVILVDINMPVMGGVETAKIIRKDIKSEAPIIALTGSGLGKEKDILKDAGINDILVKPIRANMLQGILQKWMHGKSFEITQTKQLM